MPHSRVRSPKGMKGKNLSQAMFRTIRSDLQVNPMAEIQKWIERTDRFEKALSSVVEQGRSLKEIAAHLDRISTHLSVIAKCQLADSRRKGRR